MTLNRSRSENDVNYTSYFRRSEIDEVYKPEDNDNSLIRYCSQIIENGNQIIIQRSYHQIIHKNRCWSETSLEKHNSVNAVTDYIDKSFNDYPKHISNNLLTNSFNLENMSEKSLRTNSSYGGYMEKEIPMDVDFGNENENNDYESTRTSTIGLKHTKEIRKLNNERLITNPKLGKSKLNILVIMSITVLLIAYYLLLYTVPPEDTQIQQIEEISFNLDSILYQDHVKEIIIKKLSIINGSTKSKQILVFVGSTGVGKTYTVNLIRKLFPQKYILDINFLLDTHLNIDNIKASLRSDECYFVTIDDLKINNLNDVISYIDQLPEKCMLIIPIFNIHDVDDNLIYTVNYDNFKTIKQEFVSKLPSSSEVVLFNNINRDNLEIWLRDHMDARGISKEEAITLLLDEHDVQIYGFKGLSSKINVIDL